VIYTDHLTLLRQLNQGAYNGEDMQLGWEVQKFVENFGGEISWKAVDRISRR